MPTVGCNDYPAKVRKTWPGNVRQLFDTLLQAAVMTDGDVIGRQDVADAIAEVPGKPSADLMEQPLGEGFVLAEFLEEIQRHYLIRGIKEAGGMKTKAAELLGYKNYQTLAAQLDRLNMSIPARKWARIPVRTVAVERLRSGIWDGPVSG